MGLPSSLLWPVLWGGLLASGLAVVVAGAVPRTARLGDALHALDEQPPQPLGPELSLESGDWDSRLGRWAYSHLRLPVTQGTIRRLALTGRTVGDLMAEKLIFAVGGLMAPLLLSAVMAVAGVSLGTLPVAVSLAAMVAGYLIPDVLLRSRHGDAASDAGVQVLTLFDLVTLERLANQSALGSIQAATGLSEVLVFRRIRQVLDRARLEQRSPWPDLERLSEELGLPQIRDLSDVLRLDDQGASLGGALRARVRELRDAQLMADKVEAQKVSESMTIWMVIPTLALGLFLVAPPLLRLVGV